jgi:hypothetical protein
MYEAAKWLKVSLLADDQEFASLFSLLGDFFLFPLGRLISPGEKFLSRDLFLEETRRWKEKLIDQQVPLRSDLQKVVASALSVDEESVYLQEISEEKSLVKIRRPVIQIQAHFFTYSKEEKAIYSGVFGRESIFWGVQFSYPQIFFDPEEQAHKKVDESISNTRLFRTLQRWVRTATKPLFFLMDGERRVAPFRLGKNCFSWIRRHPQIIAQGLEIL